MKILFKSVSIRNFLSVGNDPVVVHFKPGLHIITGINKDKEDRRNGVGKSAIADAIYFAIFGNTIRELKKEMIVNNLTKEGCEVVLEFVSIANDVETEYRIVRSLEPSRCEFYINNEDRTRDSIPNTTQLITEKLQTTPEVFENCVLMSVNSTVPFMAKKRVEKRKFIESIFNLEIFGKMLSTLKGEYNEARRNFDITSTKYDEILKSLETFKKQQESFATDRRARLEKLTARKAGNNKQIEELKKKIVELDSDTITQARTKINDFESKLLLCDERISTIEKTVSQNETTIKFKRSQHNKIGTDEDRCYVCLKPIVATDQEHFKAEKSRIQAEISDLEKQNEKYDESLTSLHTLRSKLRDAIQQQNGIIQKYELKIKDNKTHQSEIDQLNVWNSEIDTELRSFTSETLQFKDDSKEIVDRAEAAKKDLEAAKKQINILDTVRFVISEEGVKSSLVKRMLQLFNSKLAYYLKRMDANCVCVFNEYFEEEIVNEKGVPCSYFNFSGAERKNIDLACLFAFMDLRRLQGGVSYNISLYDELFDSSVDEKGLDLVLDILHERISKYNESVMVISHRKESIKAVTGEVICLQKQNGITTRVDFTDDLN